MVWDADADVYQKALGLFVCSNLLLSQCSAMTKLSFFKVCQWKKWESEQSEVSGMWMVITHKVGPDAAKHFRLFFSPTLSHLVTELPPSQWWSWEEAPSRLLVRRKALNSGQQSTPCCNIHHKCYLLKLQKYNPKNNSKTTTIYVFFVIWICRQGEK